ncbi:protein of unknown function [Xenorhabdus poinarii G6]|uniref:Uncharacterized protein n=1 Tax=Xenorhabdus poinarii G6 TaxID=1354304 RepID=A0A068R8P5_9GAMM|nr:protein of unknown function [Xenorhabdus poinarii G6]
MALINTTHPKLPYIPVMNGYYYMKELIYDDNI